MTTTMASRRRPATGSVRSRAFTLIEMSVVLVILGMMVIGLVALLPALTDRMRLDRTETGFTGIDEAITGFALMNVRLPCPDTNGNGLEGSGAAAGCGPGDVVGTVPYRSLGLPGPALDESRLPLRYGVYRNAGADADLALLTELFEPALPNTLDVTPGSVLSCNTQDPNLMQIVYEGPADSTLTFTGASGTFQAPAFGPNPTPPPATIQTAAGEYIGGALLEFINLTPGTPPYPDCACGVPAPQPDPGNPVCSACTTFLVGEIVEGSGAGATADIDSFETPGASINIGLPRGEFTVGETITGKTSYVTAQVSALTNPIVQVVTNINATSVGVNLIPAPPAFPGFRPSQKLFGSSGTTATFVSLSPPVVTNFTTGEQIVGGTSGATATVGADTGSLLTATLTSGTFQVGETITGQSSGTTGTIVSVRTGVFAAPQITRGTITYTTPNVSGATNKLDYCVSLRNAIIAASTSGSTSYTHTVNQQAPPVAINPAYLLVSGGVEDANGSGADQAFDGLNEIAVALDFVSPQQGRNAVYDDLVSTTPLETLEYRFHCAENIGAVNALAVDATVMQNIAIVAFYRNEQALQLIDQSYQALKLAEVNRDIAAVMLTLDALSAAVSITHAVMHSETSVPALAAIAIELIALANDIASLVMAQLEVDDAEDAYADSCDAQTATAAALGPTVTAAGNALNRAIAADAAGGVR